MDAQSKQPSVYLRRGAYGKWKVGLTINPDKRDQDYTTQDCDGKLIAHFILDNEKDMKDAERSIHAKLAKYTAHENSAEWFHAEAFAEVVDAFVDVAEEYDAEIAGSPEWELLTTTTPEEYRRKYAVPHMRKDCVIEDLRRSNWKLRTQTDAAVHELAEGKALKMVQEWADTEANRLRKAEVQAAIDAAQAEQRKADALAEKLRAEAAVEAARAKAEADRAKADADRASRAKAEEARHAAEAYRKSQEAEAQATEERRKEQEYNDARTQAYRRAEGKLADAIEVNRDEINFVQAWYWPLFCVMFLTPGLMIGISLPYLVGVGVMAVLAAVVKQVAVYAGMKECEKAARNMYRQGFDVPAEYRPAAQVKGEGFVMWESRECAEAC